MARQKDNSSPSTGKMTIMMVQLEGSDATLQEGIRTFKEALSRTMPVVPPRHAIQSKTLPSTQNEEPSLFSELPDDDLESQELSENSDSKPASTPRKSNGPRKFPKMSIVSDLNLKPSDKQTLINFSKEKKSDKQNEFITVCVYYLQKILSIEAITYNHVYTCLDELKKRKPNDLPQTMRNIASNNAYIDVSNPQQITLTVKGINLVEHDLSSTDNE